MMGALEFEHAGKEHYKHKEYKKAIEAFTKGINVSSDSINLLSYRAAAYEKAGDTRSALQDGRTMIKLDKQEVRGYLRTGKILEKMGKTDTARGIYKYGLEHVPASDKDYKLLQGMHDKLTHELAPPKSSDLFAALPVELAEMVMSYLNFRQMVNCLRVSKQWFKFLTSSQALWLDWDFSSAKKDVKPRFIREAMKRANCKVKNVTINRWNDAMELRRLTMLCKSLESLQFLSGGLHGEPIVEAAVSSHNLKILRLSSQTEIALHQVEPILRQRPTLRIAEFENVLSVGVVVDWKVDLPNLETLTLVAGERQALGQLALSLQRLKPRTPNLRHLRLEKWSLHSSTGGRTVDFHEWTKLESLVLRNFHLRFQPSLPPTLNTLVVDPASGLDDLFIYLNPNLPGNANTNLTVPVLPNLTELEYTHLGQIGQPNIYVLLYPDEDTWTVIENSTWTTTVKSRFSEYAKLKRLSLSGMHDESLPGTFIQLLSHPRLAELEDLDISRTTILDTATSQLPDILPHIKRLNLSRTNITGVAVKAIVKKYDGKLQWLGLDFCLDVGADAVQWARSKGVEVSHRLQAQNAKSGKRIRYG